jgi:hypothetical protein
MQNISSLMLGCILTGGSTGTQKPSRHVPTDSQQQHAEFIDTFIFMTIKLSIQQISTLIQFRLLRTAHLDRYLQLNESRRITTDSPL